MDVDFDSASKKKGQQTNPPTSLPPGEQSSGSNTRRSSNAAAPTPPVSTKATPPGITKDEIPGMSSFSVNPESSTLPRPTPLSRKRKAPGASPAANASNQPLPSAAPNRRTASVLNSNQVRMSNTLTFERCGGLLRNGKLKADDGTVIGVDGKSSLQITWISL